MSRNEVEAAMLGYAAGSESVDALRAELNDVEAALRDAEPPLTGREIGPAISGVGRDSDGDPIMWIDTLATRIARIAAERDHLAAELSREQGEGDPSWGDLAVALDRALTDASLCEAERDRARATAVRLEQELGALRLWLIRCEAKATERLNGSAWDDAQAAAYAPTCWITWGPDEVAILAPLPPRPAQRRVPRRTGHFRGKGVAASRWQRRRYGGRRARPDMANENREELGPRWPPMIPPDVSASTLPPAGRIDPMPSPYPEDRR